MSFGQESHVFLETIYEDVQYWKKRCGNQIKRIKANDDDASADIGLTALRLEGIAQAALQDYELAKTPQFRNLFLNTAIKAEKVRADMLVATGVWPKAGEDIRIHQEIDATFTAKLGNLPDDSPLKALDSASSRRKVLDAAELLLKSGVEKLKNSGEPKKIEGKVVDKPATDNT